MTTPSGTGLWTQQGVRRSEPMRTAVGDSTLGCQGGYLGSKLIPLQRLGGRVAWWPRFYLQAVRCSSWGLGCKRSGLNSSEGHYVSSSSEFALRW